MKIKQYFIKNFPFLGKYKRIIKGYYHSIIPIKESYSQHGEDIVIYNHLNQSNFKFNPFYIDIGSNHPTDISNTYLFYRKGYNGFLIEPNLELCLLSRKIRKNDYILNIGIASISTILLFNVSRTPVGSSFNSTYFYKREQILDKVEFVPVMPLNSVFTNYTEDKLIGFLNIDVEGMNFEVLSSSSNLIKKVYIICIEYDTIEERNNILQFIDNFTLIVDNGCNLILKNNYLC